ncbi:MAG TPA: ABC transporter substrate-binding protein [Chloroflexota bacterium]|nr:ABC transporter substrate-binding protein [Chloroflexota bacterium]
MHTIGRVAWALLGAALVAACSAGPASRPEGAAPRGAVSIAGTPEGASVTTTSAGQTPAPLPKVTVSYSSVSGTFLPVWIAVDEGLFAKHGLDVDITYIASGTTSMQSLIAGDLQFIVSSGAEPAAAYLGGAPTRIVLGWFHALSALFMTDPSITSPEQLRGKPVGITRFGGQPHVAARLALKKWGLDPDRDVQYLQLGGTPEILAAMQSGTVVGGAFAPPTNVRAQRLGFRVLGDLGQMDIPYQAGVLAGMQSYLEANPEATRRFVQAMLDAIQVSLTDDASTYAVLAKYTRTDDPDLLHTTIDYYRQVVSRVPYPTLEGLQTVLDDLAESDPRARTVRPEQLVNTTALEQLDRAGYIQRLYDN